MNIKNTAASAAAILLLAACSVTGTPFSGDLTPPAEGLGKLYVYRSPAFKGSAIYYGVYAGSELVGTIRNGGYISKELPAGDYEIWAKTEAKRGIKLSLKPNSIQCVKASVGWGAFAGRPKLESVPLEQCNREIRNTKASM